MSDSRGGTFRANVDEDGSVVAGLPGRQLSGAQKVAVAALMLVVFLGFIWINQLNKATQTIKQPELEVSAGGAFHPPPAQMVAPAPPPMSLPMPSSAPAPSFFVPAKHEASPAESPILAFSGSGAAEAALASAPAPSAIGTLGQHDSAGNRMSALGSMLKPTVLHGAKARLLPHPDMMVTMGTMIPCTLQTAIDSQLAGYVKCVLPQDVRSTTGDVVLLDRGTTVVGEIGHGLVQGQDRVFVLWDRAETPDHAVIELTSPGTDELGRSGLPGRVDNHWWERFGSAILLSVIQGGLETGTALAAHAGSGGGTFFNSFQSNGTNVSDTALQATINIPPTLEKNQGDNVSIFVARDLDIADVYNLRVTGADDAE